MQWKSNESKQTDLPLRFCRNSSMCHPTKTVNGGSRVGLRGKKLQKEHEFSSGLKPRRISLCVQFYVSCDCNRLLNFAIIYAVCQRLDYAPQKKKQDETIIVGLSSRYVVRVDMTEVS